MGVFSWIWNLISGFFSGSRYKEEREERADETKAARLSKKQEKLEKKENEQLEIIVVELERIYKQLSETENPVIIKIGNKEIDVAHAVKVLISSLYNLVGTQTSIKSEEKTLRRIMIYWSATQQGLSSAEMGKEVRRINKLFKELGVELTKEDKLTGVKLEFIRRAYKLALKEEGEAEAGEEKEEEMPQVA